MGRDHGVLGWGLGTWQANCGEGAPPDVRLPPLQTGAFVVPDSQAGKGMLEKRQSGDGFASELAEEMKSLLLALKSQERSTPWGPTVPSLG